MAIFRGGARCCSLDVAERGSRRGAPRDARFRNRGRSVRAFARGSGKNIRERRFGMRRALAGGDDGV
jgi:hypothetical protein